MTETLSGLALHLFPLMARLSLTGSVAILAVLLVRFMLRRAPTRFAYALWGVAAFRLLCPVSFTAVFSLFSLNPLQQPLPAGRPVTLAVLTSDLSEIMPGQVFSAPDKTAPLDPVMQGQAGQARLLLTAALLLWLSGILVLLIYGAVSYLNVRRQVAGSVRIAGQVYASDRIPTPFVLGLFRPRIYLPFRLADPERAYILQHERYHIRHGDHLVKLLSFFVLAFHWFNPLVWLAYSCMARDMEMRCDEAVLQTRSGAVRRDYSASLLALACRTRLPAASPLAFGESHVKARIRNVLNFKKPKTWIVLTALLLCIAAVIVIAADPPVSQRTLKPEELGPLDEAVRQAVLAKYEPVDYIGNFSAEAHTILEAVTSGNEVTVYAYVLYRRYQIDAQGIREGGGNHMPVALTFRQSDYQLLEYWIPENGNEYGPSIRRKFPHEIALLAMDSQRFIEQHSQACDAQAMAYFEAMPNPPHGLTGSRDHVDAFLQLARETGFDQLPRMYPNDRCYNVTPAQITEQTGCLVFKYDQSCAAFLQVDGQIYPIATGWGGYGLTDIQLCDFAGDGQMDLLYTFSWGSGIHRAQIGHFNLATREERVFNYASYQSELYVKPISGSHFIVYAADISAFSSFTNLTLTSRERLAELTGDASGIVLTPLG